MERFRNMPQHSSYQKGLTSAETSYPEFSLLGCYHRLTNLGEGIYPTQPPIMFQVVEGKYSTPANLSHPLLPKKGEKNTENHL